MVVKTKSVFAMEKLFTVLLLGLSISASAQIEFTKLESTDKDNPMDISNILELESVKGSPLGFRAWLKGRAVSINRDTSGYYLINYHTQGDGVFFMDSATKDVFETDESNIASLLISSDEGNENLFRRIPWHEFKVYPKNPRICQILVDKPGFELVKYYDKKFEKSEDITLPEVNRVAYLDFYIPEERYFWRGENEEQYAEVNFTKSWLKTILNKEQQKRFKDYQRQNKVRWKKEQEVIAMLEAVL